MPLQIDPDQPPAPSRDPEQARAEAKKKKSSTVATIVLGLIVVVGGLKALWTERAERGADDALGAFVAEQRARLPLDLGDGLVLTEVKLEQDDITYIVKVDADIAAALRDPATAERVRAAEIESMRAACEPLDPFFATGTIVRRRFVADDGGTPLEVQLDRAACARR